MNEVLNSIDWMQVIQIVWTIVLLPIITYIGAQINSYFKAKKIDKNANILYENVLKAVKDVYETTVKDIKGTPDWTEEKKLEVKEIAKTKAVNAPSVSAYQMLKQANFDFEKYLDSLIGAALYDLKK